MCGVDSKCSFTERATLEKWKGKLGLTDWEIVLCTNCNSEDTGHNVASTEWDEVHKAAVIKIIRPSESIIPFIFEKTLIHELLHIKLALFDGHGDFQDRYLHQIIEEFAWILFTTDKQKGGRNS